MTLTVVSKPAHGGDVDCQRSSDGWLTGPSDNVTVDAYPDENVTVTAVAKPGYKFVNWTGDVEEIADPAQETIVVAMDKYYAGRPTEIEITANFRRTSSFPWAWVAGGLAALLLVALGLAILVRRRKKRRIDAQPP